MNRGRRKGQIGAKVKPETKAKLQRLGWERALIYKSLVLTGLRRKELASLTVDQLELDGAAPYVVLEACDEKNREGSQIALREDLVSDLQKWLAHKLRLLQREARRRDEPVRARLPSDTPVFDVPEGLVKILDRDLKAAGIPKRDERGRTIDVHAFRHTLGTHLSKGGVPLRTAQSVLRHSDPKLTANVYTDPALLDVAGALNVLPALPLDQKKDTQEKKATGTDNADSANAELAPMLAPTPDHSGPSQSFSDESVSVTEKAEKTQSEEDQAHNVLPRQKKNPADNSSQRGDSGDPGRILTYDLLLRRQSLYTG